MNKQIVYNLSDVPNFNTLISTGSIPEDEKFFSVKNFTTKSNENYSIVRYYKEFLNNDMINTYGILRSVILSGSNVVSFSPPKSISAEVFITKYPSKTENIVAQEFIEGTMINVFFDPAYGANGCWQIATRNTIGGNVTFYKFTSNKTFNQMFMDACNQNNLNIQTLDPRCCYSFVLQHPCNRIVIPIKMPQLYLVGVYNIVKEMDNIKVIEHDLRDIKNSGIWNLTSVRFPDVYEFDTYNELIEKYASGNTKYDTLGVVIRNMTTGERTKFRNPVYEEVRHLRGNQPKLQFQYLSLRHSGKMPEFLKYYPEMKSEMSKYRDMVHVFTENLHKNYISCYVKKEQKLGDYPPQFRTHMFKLHEHFINNLRPKGLCIINTEVIKYVNQLPPSLLMYCLNINMRKRLIDTIKLDTPKN